MTYMKAEGLIEPAEPSQATTGREKRPCKHRGVAEDGLIHHCPFQWRLKEASGGLQDNASDASLCGPVRSRHLKAAAGICEIRPQHSVTHQQDIYVSSLYTYTAWDSSTNTALRPPTPTSTRITEHKHVSLIIYARILCMQAMSLKMVAFIHKTIRQKWIIPPWHRRTQTSSHRKQRPSERERKDEPQRMCLNTEGNWWEGQSSIWVVCQSVRTLDPAVDFERPSGRCKGPSAVARMEARSSSLAHKSALWALGKPLQQWKSEGIHVVSGNQPAPCRYPCRHIPSIADHGEAEWKKQR